MKIGKLDNKNFVGLVNIVEDVWYLLALLLPIFIVLLWLSVQVGVLSYLEVPLALGFCYIYLPLMVLLSCVCFFLRVIMCKNTNDLDAFVNNV